MSNLTTTSYKNIIGLQKALLLETPLTQAGQRFKTELATAYVEFSKIINFQLSLPDFSHLPKPITNQFMGSELELKRIENIFEQEQYLGILGLIAERGLGKAALTFYEWLLALKVAKEHQTPVKLFKWSFYLQCSHQQTFISSNNFFCKALTFFGFTGELPSNGIQQARLLAKYFRAAPHNFLILEGLELLQYPVGKLNGEIADIAMREFLVQIRVYRQSNNGILLISRQAIVEMQTRNDDYQENNFDVFTDNEGTEVLKKWGIKGAPTECQALTRQFNGHALSLRLFAALLHKKHDGFIRHSQEILTLDSERKYGAQAKHQLFVKYYAEILNSQEKQLMHCLSLFDHAMYWREKDALLMDEGLTKKTFSFKKFFFAKANQAHFEELKQLSASEEDWQGLQNSLENKGLLLKQDVSCKEASGEFERTHWNTPACLRRFFAQQFQEQHPVAFQHAHSVLFNYFQSIPETECPDNLDDLVPLYRAVVHGCLAEKYQVALDEVLKKRIQRGKEYYSQNKLGAYSQELIALSAFFPQGWEQPTNQLSLADQACLLSEASFCLMSLGRLKEAVVTRSAELKLNMQLHDERKVARSGRKLIKLLILTGQLKEAHETALWAVKYTADMQDLFEQISSCAQLAITLHCLGKLPTAQTYFEQAEQLQQCYQPEHPYLYAQRGAEYGFLLLDLAQTPADLEAILQRGHYSLQISQTNDNAKDMAFDYLLLARTYQALQNREEAQKAFDLAIEYVQKAKKANHLPSFFLARAAFCFQQAQLDEAKADLDSAYEIINRCGMTLSAVDSALFSARYHFKIEDMEMARKMYERAEMLLARVNYQLRNNELKNLRKSFD